MLPHSRTCNHAVLFYKDGAWLREQVGHHVMAALRAGRPALVIAKPDLLQELKIALHREHVQGAPFGPQRGLLVTMDAADTLASICVDGHPDPELFRRFVGVPVQRLAQDGPAAAYGEMVGILCERGQYADAVELEHLWNELLAACQASLYCGYHHRLFKSREGKGFYDRIRTAHAGMLEDPQIMPALAA